MWTGKQTIACISEHVCRGLNYGIRRFCTQLYRDSRDYYLKIVAAKFCDHWHCNFDFIAVVLSVLQLQTFCQIKNTNAIGFNFIFQTPKFAQLFGLSHWAGKTGEVSFPRTQQKGAPAVCKMSLSTELLLPQTCYDKLVLGITAVLMLCFTKWVKLYS